MRSTEYASGELFHAEGSVPDEYLTALSRADAKGAQI
jgi:hypothetical protein